MNKKIILDYIKGIVFELSIAIIMLCALVLICLILGGIS